MKECSICGARADVHEKGVLYCAACFEDRERSKSLEPNAKPAGEKESNAGTDAGRPGEGRHNGSAS